MVNKKRKIRTITSFRDKYFFLSNFAYYAAAGNFNLIYPSAEHAYVSYKCTTLRQVRALLHIPLPWKVKRHGHTIKLPENWEEKKIEHMYSVVHSKFFSNIRLSRLLVSTGDASLIERNDWHDNVWGDCTCYQKECSDIGENNLGIILMSVRDELNAYDT